MRITQLRQADLNLLVVFTALAEERSVSRAASRLFLSQPALSRALQRLRDMFHDDLLIRTPTGYEPTPRGERLQQELSVMLPRLDRLLSGATFDPADEDAAFRIAVSDNASQVLCPLFCQMVLPYAERVSCQFVALHDGTFEAMERGRLDLALNADDGHTPDRFHREVIYEDEFVCVVARASRSSRKLTLKQYLAGLHVGVGVLTGRQTIPEQRLASLGKKRKCAVEVPYFTAAIRCVRGTNLIATVPKRLAELERHDPAIKLVQPPAEMQGFRYLMIWHPRLHSDAAHVWLRSMMAATGKKLSGLTV
ncbi:MAG: LysR family transcriptional regulator [Luteitalea sp.]|nr:LysR family transcriptional regulator [Luteitalea sp.]